LALGAGLPLAAVPTLDAMTRLVPFVDATVCPMLDAKMGEVFGAVYRFTGGLRTKLVPETVCTAEVLATGISGVSFLGDGSIRYRCVIEQVSREAEFVPAWLGAPRASAVAVEAMALLAQGVSTDPASVVPVYLRKSQAELNRAKAQTP
jgi:tRNA threonylcarbamoyladenosine biosynthesis protein TsaB